MILIHHSARSHFPAEHSFALSQPEVGKGMNGKGIKNPLMFQIYVPFAPLCGPSSGSSNL
jgi:hypothetical protein